MKKLLIGIAITVLGLSLASPALAGHSGQAKGHRGRQHYSHQRYLAPLPHYHHHHSRLRAGLYIGAGYPVYAPAYFGYGYVYGPPAVVIAPSPYHVWIPGHYVVRTGARVYVEGYWAPRGQR